MKHLNRIVHDDDRKISDLVSNVSQSDVKGLHYSSISEYGPI